MPSPSPSPDCRVAAPEWSRQCGPRRDDASPCCTTATASQPVRVDRLFFLLHSSRDRSSQPASAAAADPARKQIPRAASGTADPWSGWRGGAPEGWSRPSVAGTIRAWTAPLRAKWSTGRRDWVNLVFFLSCARGPGQRGVALPSLPSKAAIVSRLQSVCVASPQNGTAAEPLDRLLSRWPRTRLLDI